VVDLLAGASAVVDLWVAASVAVLSGAAFLGAALASVDLRDPLLPFGRIIILTQVWDFGRVTSITLPMTLTRMVRIRTATHMTVTPAINRRRT